MATDAPMATATDPALTLAQWFSPGFPVGGFHFSHGLEWAIDAGDVTDADTTKAWIAQVLEHGSGRNDAILLAAAYHAADDATLLSVDATARALAATRERRIETEEMGAAFARIAGALLDRPLPALTYPVAAGHAAQLAGLPQVLTAQFYLQAFAANLATVAMRLVPIGQTDGQTVIRDLTPLCRRIAAETAEGDMDALSSTVFLPDIAAMKHETQATRIFRT